MKLRQKTDARLVLSANRRWIGILNLIVAPIPIWLGLLVIGEGRDTWFGYVMVILGAGMILIGILGLFQRISLVLDRDEDLVRYTIRGRSRRRHRTMPLSEVARVALEERRAASDVGARHSYYVVVFHPKEKADRNPLVISEFWSRNGAADAHFAIARWMGEPEARAGQA